MVGGFRLNPQGIRDLQRAVDRELARHPVHVPVEATVGRSTGRGVQQAEPSWSRTDVAATLLLEWMWQRPDLTSTLVTVGDLCADRDEHPLRPVVEQVGSVAALALAEQGLVELPSWSEPEDPHFILTDAGRHAAARQAERRDDRRARTLQAREALLAWAYDNRDDGPLDVTAILASPHGWFMADMLSPVELEAAVEHLRGLGFVGGEPRALTLTDEGVEALERHGGVAEHQRASEAKGVSVHFTGDNNGQLAIGNRDVQQNQTQGGDAKVLEVYARGLREFAGLLSEGGERDDLEHVASSLEREAAKPEPDQGRVRHLIDLARSVLGSTKELNGLAQVTRLGLEVYNTAHGGS